MLSALVEKWRANAKAADLFAEEPQHSAQAASNLQHLAAQMELCADDLAALLVSSWQPIGNHPKDGTWLLGWHPDLGHFVWRDGPGLLTGEDPEPSHWMPLPEPPALLVSPGCRREEKEKNYDETHTRMDKQP